MTNKDAIDELYHLWRVCSERRIDASRMLNRAADPEPLRRIIARETHAMLALTLAIEALKRNLQ